MAEFIYTARDEIGRVYKGTMVAAEESLVRAKLKKRGLFATALRQSRAKKSFFALVGKKVPVAAVVLFTERLSAMVNAGLPIIKCLRTLARQTDDQVLRKVIYGVCIDLEGGERFSDALSKHPAVFSNFYIDMIKTGETGCLLDEVLMRIAEHLTKEQELKRKIKKAFAYPIIVLSAIAVVVTFLIIFIVPIFAEVYSKMRIALPVPTVLLVTTSKIFIRYWWVVISGIAGVVFVYKKAYATERGRLFIDRIKLEFPVFGPLNQKVAISRFVSTFASLFASGVSVMEALGVIREISGNVVITNIIDSLREDVREGRKIADALSREKLFPPMVTQMVAAGEEAGALDAMLKKSADFLNRDIDYEVGKLVTKIEPLLTVFLAIVVGFIALAIYLPMFDLTANMMN